jgi:hypothetical protein
MIWAKDPTKTPTVSGLTHPYRESDVKPSLIIGWIDREADRDPASRNVFGGADASRHF